MNRDSAGGTLPVDLAGAIRHAIDHALSTGALLPVSTESATVTDGGVRFILRWVSSLSLKALAKKLPRPGDKPTNFNPFLPFDQDLWVADMSATHVALLNKFPSQDGHLVLITREFRKQESPLDAADFDALARLLMGVDGLAFFNGGTVAGSSQGHKHMQLIPTSDIPVEAVLPVDSVVGKPCQVAALPFRHAFVRLDDSVFLTDPAHAAMDMQRAFEAACISCGIVERDGEMSPYNMLATRRWMMVVPRVQETCDLGGGERLQISALWFAGTAFATRPEQIPLLQQAGLMRVLTQATDSF